MLNAEQSNQILQRLLQMRQIDYAITDRTGIVTAVNGALRFIDSEHALGQPISVGIPELIGYEDQLQAILDGEELKIELPIVNRTVYDDAPDGEDQNGDGQRTAYAKMLVLPFCNNGKEAISGLIVFAKDITETGVVQQRIMQQRNELTLLRKQLEIQNRQLQAANRELQQLNELKSRFVAVAAHELRTPLTSISGYTELLSDGSFGVIGEEQHRPLEIITQSTARLLLIINNLLDISRIEAGRVQLHLRPAALDTLVHRCLEEERLRFDEKRQAIRLDLPTDTPTLLCDEARTMQILGNLISNASKYTPEDGTVTLAAAPAAEEGYLEITVTDNGIGIPLAEQQHVFESFYRASNVSEIDTIGAGLGLHITRALIELQGGEISCTSTPGQGATFFFTVPLAEEEWNAHPNSTSPSTSPRLIARSAREKHDARLATQSGAQTISPTAL